LPESVGADARGEEAGAGSEGHGCYLLSASSSGSRERGGSDWEEWRW
jgi:hypothetical protein